MLPDANNTSTYEKKPKKTTETLIFERLTGCYNIWYDNFLFVLIHVQAVFFLFLLAIIIFPVIISL